MKKAKNQFQYVHQYTNGIRTWLVAIFFFSLISSLLTIFFSIVNKQIFDGFVNIDIEVMIYITLVMALVYFIFGGFNYLYKIAQNKISNRLRIRIRMAFYKEILSIRFIDYQRYLSDDFFYRMFIDINIVVDFYLRILLVFPIQTIMFCFSLVLMLLWSWALTVIVLVLVLIQWLITILYIGPTNRINKIMKESEQFVMGKINKDFQQLELIRGFSLEQEKNKESCDIMFDLAKKDLSNTKIRESYNGIIYFINSTGSLIILLIGLFFVARQVVTLGTVMAFTMLISYFGGSITGVAGIFTNYFQSKISYNRVLEVLDMRDKYINRSDIKIADYMVKIQQLSYSYGDNVIYSKFNLKIEEGEVIEIKGANGAGKTTLCRLLTRYIYPIDGQIYIGEHELSEIDILDFRKKVIYIGEPMILPSTLRKNLDFNDEYTNEEINDVISKCNLQNLIEKKGWELEDQIIISEAELSLGEKQKIAIARAFLRKPKILILDEPTANLDDKTTHQIVTNLLQFNQDTGCTLIIAAHDQRIDNYISKKIYL